MHRLSLAFTIVMLAVLGAYALFQPPKEIRTYAELTTLIENTRIETQGRVLKQTFSHQTSYLLLTNNITLSIKDTKSYLNETVKARGTLDTYRYPKLAVTKITKIPPK
ncbi:hypothetical protein FJZ22_02905 [Candidatus Pacearchaeota archaeon]|nr:hypothetical protein [Candidatus Pacearchaeota archaeon]